MSNWPEAVEQVEGITLRVSTKTAFGTGFVINYHDHRLVIATAWHVLEDLARKDVKLISVCAPSGNIKLDVRACGVARLGPEGCDVGLVWIGKGLTSPIVDEILWAFVNSGIEGGLLNVRGGGGGGVLKATDGFGKPILAEGGFVNDHGVTKEPGDSNIAGSQQELPAFRMRPLVPKEQIRKGLEVGCLGFPSLATETACFFHGRISGFRHCPEQYLVDGTGLPGMSGGPVFDAMGRILGIVSFHKLDPTTMGGLVGVVPIEPIAAISFKS